MQPASDKEFGQTTFGSVGQGGICCADSAMKAMRDIRSQFRLVHRARSAGATVRGRNTCPPPQPRAALDPLGDLARDGDDEAKQRCTVVLPASTDYRTTKETYTTEDMGPVSAPRNHRAASVRYRLVGASHLNPIRRARGSGRHPMAHDPGAPRWLRRYTTNATLMSLRPCAASSTTRACTTLLRSAHVLTGSPIAGPMILAYF